MVVDSSALLAVLFNENYADWVSEKLNSSVTALRMSTVNYAEVLILIEDDRPQLLSLMETQILSAPIRLVPPTVEQAEIAAKARLRYPLNLGDCFAYALAKDDDAPLLTLDRDFRRTDIALVVPPGFHGHRS